MGTPSTGSVVCAAVMAGKCAAPPAPAMMTSMPRPSAPVANSAISSGVRWAETTRFSCATPNSVSISLAARMVSQSDLLPMIMDTTGEAAGVLLPLRECESLLAIESTQCFGLDDIVSGGRDLLIERRNLGVRDCLARRGRHWLEAATITVGHERFRHAPRPHDGASIIHHAQLDAFVGDMIQRVAELLRCPAIRTHIKVHAHDFDLLKLARGVRHPFPAPRSETGVG